MSIKKTIRLLSLFGVGLLLGAVLMVVIPEGVNTIYEAETTTAPHTPDNPVVPESTKNINEPIKSTTNETDHHSHHLTTIHHHVGLALLIGYLAMLTIDQLATSTRLCHWILSKLSCCCTRRIRLPLTASTCCSSIAVPSSTDVTTSTSTSSSITTTLGLVFHSLADGCALGAAFATGQPRLELILFLAVLLHKLPAGFGLSTYLVANGLTHSHIRMHLLAFSLASPLASLCTLISLASLTNLVDKQTVAYRTGFTLLLSGGTFLYVAASHMLPDLIKHQREEFSLDQGRQGTDVDLAAATNDLRDEGQQPPLLLGDTTAGVGYRIVKEPDPRLTLTELTVLLLGSAIPVLISSSTAAHHRH